MQEITQDRQETSAFSLVEVGRKSSGKATHYAKPLEPIYFQVPVKHEHAEPGSLQQIKM